MATRPPPKSPRKPRADGTTFAVETAAMLADPLPEPPLPLRPLAAKYWPQIISAKLPVFWTELDLQAAWGLAEDMAALEEARLVLQSEPAYYRADDGRIREHPAVKAVDVLERRIQSTKRHLQISSAAVNGKADVLKGKNQAGRQIAKAMHPAADDDLIAGPQ